MYHIEYGLYDDADVEGERPVFEIPDVADNALLHLPHFLGFATVAVYLSPTSDARFHPETHRIAVDALAVIIVVQPHVRTGSYEAHIAKEHINQLRQLIDIVLAHPIAKRIFARVVLGSLFCVCLGVYVHTAEFVTKELLAVPAATLLTEKYRAGRLDFDDDAN